MVSQSEPSSFCLETKDGSSAVVDASRLILGRPGRQPAAQAARLADQFVVQNRAVLREFDSTVTSKYDGSKAEIHFHAGSTVGAIPLKSPTTGKPDVSLIVQPRFDWNGIGELLMQMGAKVSPEIPPNLPLLPQSARNIPPWVLSVVVLPRLERLIDQLHREFSMVDEDVVAPRGSVHWDAYATQRISRMQFLAVPCRYPDLRENHQLKSAINFVLRKQLESLQTQRSSGPFVAKLINLCVSLLARVQDVSPRQPNPAQLASWFRLPLTSQILRQGLQSIEWTVEERGLGGVSELRGLPWKLDMIQVFEAWTETIGHRLAQEMGGVMRSARKGETVTPISWEEPYLGSQKSLIPDVMIDRGDETIVVDAKYKEHWEELASHRWANLDEGLREHHRADLLQILAYCNLTSAQKVSACLVYPCQRGTWESLQEKGRTFRRATIHAGGRKLSIILTTLPMVASVEEAAASLKTAVAA